MLKIAGVAFEVIYESCSIYWNAVVLDDFPNAIEDVDASVYTGLV